MLLASVVVSVPSHALVWGCPEGASYFYHGECHNCPQGKVLNDKGMCVDSAVKCASNQYMLNGKCTACQQGATCDGVNIKCLYGQLESNGIVNCNYKPGLNYSCVNFIVRDGKCADISDMCPKGQTAKADSTGKVSCTGASACQNDKNGGGIDTGCTSAKPMCGSLNVNGAGDACYLCENDKTGANHDTGCIEKERPMCGNVVHNGFANACYKCINNRSDSQTDTGCSAEKPFCDAKEGAFGNVCKANGVTCQNNQYIVNSKCVTCPKYGKCDGKNVKCPGAYTKDSKGVVTCTGPCAANMYVSASSNTSVECTACPANATCNGTKTVTCKSGYTKVTKKGGITCVAKVLTCKNNQYIVDSKCVACPKLGTCDGKNVKCPYGYTKDAKGYVTCKPKAVTCKKNQYIVNNKCVACPKGATCDGQNPKCPNGYTKDSKGYVTCKTKLCEQGSHVSYEVIKRTYKGCTKCRAESVAAGKCAKNKKAHKHYYCMCEC